MSRLRNWCFTLNNYTDKNEESIRNIDCKYLIYGKEIGEKGTKHLQGYIEFKNGKSLIACKKLIENAHWECRRGTGEQASNYCKKDNNFIELGEIGKQGNRTDISEVTENIIGGESICKIAENNPELFIKYSKGIKELKNLQYKPRNEKPFVCYLWGSTGVGKTRFAFTHHETIYIKDGTIWWDGYTQQEAIVIDDFDGRWPIRDLLRLLDRYPYMGQIKGGYININSPYIYITCDQNIEAHYDKYLREQLMRRIEYIDHLI